MDRTPRLRWAWIGGLAVSLVPMAALAGPVIHAPPVTVRDPALGTFVALSVSGEGFGTPDPLSTVTVSQGTQTVVIPATSLRVVVWKDTYIAVRLASNYTHPTVKITVLGNASATVAADEYKIFWYDTNRPPTRGTNQSPLAVAADTSGRLFINEEFHLELKQYKNGAVTGIAIPYGPEPGPFSKNNSTLTRTCKIGEDVLVDPQGKVWFQQGGWSPHNDPSLDHSRIIRFDPSISDDPGTPQDERFRVYNVPGDHNGVVGLAWDSLRNRIWFSEAWRHGKACTAPTGCPQQTAYASRIGTFDPNGVPWQNDFDFPTQGLTCNGFCGVEPTYPCTVPADCQFCTAGGTCSNNQSILCTTHADCLGVCRGPAPYRCSNIPDKGCSSSEDCLEPGVVCGLCSNDPARPCITVNDCVSVGQLCPPGPPGTNCFAEYPVESVSDATTLTTAHLAVDTSGKVWFTAYWSTKPTAEIGRLDPDTGAVEKFPLPPSTGNLNSCSTQLHKSAPWSIVRHPVDGDLMFSEYFNHTVARFDVSLIGSVDCQHLTSPNPLVDCEATPVDLSCFNPCVTRLDIPGIEPNGNTVHSVALDSGGNLWFTVEADHENQGGIASVGYVATDPTTGAWEHVVMLPPLGIFPFFGRIAECEAPGEFVGFRGAGITVNENDDVWFTSYCQKRLVKLHRIQ